MDQRVALITLVVDDYDRAIAFYVDALGFELVEDTPDTPRGAQAETGSSDQLKPKRWVVVKPRGSGSVSLLLAEASGDAQKAAVGQQTGGRVGFFLHTDDFWRDYERFRTNGVEFLEEPRVEPYGTVAVFVDFCGNKWDLLQPNLVAE